MNRNQARLVFGAAIGAAAIAVIIDHTRQRLPEPDRQLASGQAVIIIDEGQPLPEDSGGDCAKPVAAGKRASPCSL